MKNLGRLLLPIAVGTALLVPNLNADTLGTRGEGDMVAEKQQQSPLANYSFKTILYTAQKGQSLSDVAKIFYPSIGKPAEYFILNSNPSNSSMGYFDKQGKLVSTLGEGDEVDRTLLLRNDGKWVQLKDIVNFSQINSWDEIALELGIPYLKFMAECPWNATACPSPNQWIYLMNNTSKKLPFVLPEMVEDSTGGMPLMK